VYDYENTKNDGRKELRATGKGVEEAEIEMKESAKADT
jgi:hypothetical protein